MDRPVDPRFSRARSRRRVLWAATFVACVLGAAYVMQLVLGPSIRRDRVRTARVERGPVDATISATGLVLPEVEQVVTTPVDARVVRIRHRAGAPVREDDALVDLDVSQARLAVETLARDLAIKANDQARRRIALERSLIDIDGRLEVKRLQLAQFRAQLERARQLRAEGLLSVEDYRRSELAEAQAGVEVRQLQAERENAEREPRRGRRARARDGEGSWRGGRGPPVARPRRRSRGPGRRRDVVADAGRSRHPQG
jgi:HlyD family secretion protein